MIRWIEIWQKEYLIIANYEVLLKLVDWATEHEKIISFNLPAVFLVEGNKDMYEKVISNSVYLEMRMSLVLWEKLTELKADLAKSNIYL